MAKRASEIPSTCILAGSVNPSGATSILFAQFTSIVDDYSENCTFRNIELCWHSLTDSFSLFILTFLLQLRVILRGLLA